MLATTRKNPQWIATIMGNVTRVAGSEIACGFPKQKANAYPDGDSVADVAAKNCFGIGVIQRDFMTYAQPGIVAETKDTVRQIGRLVNLRGDHSSQITRLQEQAGNLAAGAIKSAIVKGTYAANSDRPMGADLRAILAKQWSRNIPEGMSYRDAKLKFKHSDKPLIDTGHMVQAVTYVVRNR